MSRYRKSMPTRGPRREIESGRIYGILSKRWIYDPFIATFLVAPGGPLVDREIEADDIGDATLHANLMRQPGMMQNVREAEHDRK